MLYTLLFRKYICILRSLWNHFYFILHIKPMFWLHIIFDPSKFKTNFNMKILILYRDLTRKVLVSKFSAPKTSFLPFVPINIFRCPTQPLSTSDTSRKKQVEDIMGETQRWSLETNNQVPLPINEEHLSLVLLVSSISNLDLHDEYKDSGVGPVGSWSLALLAKGKLVSENTLDSRYATFSIVFTQNFRLSL